MKKDSEPEVFDFSYDIKEKVVGSKADDYSSVESKTRASDSAKD